MGICWSYINRDVQEPVPYGFRISCHIQNPAGFGLPDAPPYNAVFVLSRRHVHRVPYGSDIPPSVRIPVTFTATLLGRPLDAALQRCSCCVKAGRASRPLRNRYSPIYAHARTFPQPCWGVLWTPALQCCFRCVKAGRASRPLREQPPLSIYADAMFPQPCRGVLWTPALQRCSCCVKAGRASRPLRMRCFLSFSDAVMIL